MSRKRVADEVPIEQVQKCERPFGLINAIRWLIRDPLLRKRYTYTPLGSSCPVPSSPSHSRV